MRDFVFGLLALLVFALFLGVIAWRVPDLPLILVCGFGVLLAAADLVVEARSRRRAQASVRQAGVR